MVAPGRCQTFPAGSKQHDRVCRFEKRTDSLTVVCYHVRVNYDFSICKDCGTPTASPKYRLRDSTLYMCSGCGLHYIDYLDPDTESLGVVDSEELTQRRREYYDRRHRHHPDRYQRHIDLLEGHCELQGARVLDVGCGGGLFLSLVEKKQGKGTGADLWDPAIQYARETYQLDVHKYPVEHSFWIEQYPAGFDAITMWDVIEHVNFPLETISAIRARLAPGGLLLIDTPCRDAFFHKTGAATCRLSGGRFPTLLNMLYSRAPYAHKQIISTDGMKWLIDRAGFELLRLERIFELSSPCENYLKKAFRSAGVARALAPFARAFVETTRVRNKMLVVARRR